MILKLFLIYGFEVANLLNLLLYLLYLFSYPRIFSLYLRMLSFLLFNQNLLFVNIAFLNSFCLLDIEDDIDKLILKWVFLRIEVLNLALKVINYNLIIIDSGSKFLSFVGIPLIGWLNQYSNIILILVYLCVYLTSLCFKSIFKQILLILKLN